MASQPVNPGQGAQPPPGAGGGGGAPQPGAGQGGASAANPLHIIAAITRLAQMLAQASGATAPDAEQIIQAVQSAARKLMPQQPDQKQQSPY